MPSRTGRFRWAAWRIAASVLVVTLTVLTAGCNNDPTESAEERPPVKLVNNPESVVTTDFGHSLGQFAFEPGRQLSAAPKSWRYGDATYRNLDRLDLVRVRVWLRFGASYDVTKRQPKYESEYGYLNTYHQRADTLIVNWRSDYDPLVTKGIFSERQLSAAERDMLAHYKRRYPKMEFIEAENEPADLVAYYAKYRFMYRVVAAVNALNLPGPTLKIGGPTLDTFSPYRLGQFLDLYKDDPDPAKRLDFVSYHQYLISRNDEWHVDKDNPAVVSTERAQLDALMTTRGLARRPALITEMGAFPAGRESNPQLGLNFDLHIQAACLASMHYWYLNQPGVVPLDWTIDHPENDRKDLFVNVRNGVPRPYYNALRMMSMLPRTRYEATSDSLSKRGIGVYGLAAGRSDRVAVMTWNYQWTYSVTFNSQVRLTGLPVSFRSKKVLVETYLVPGGQNSGDLKRVGRTVIGPRTDGAYTTPTLPLGPNELRMVVLTPVR